MIQGELAKMMKIMLGHLENLIAIALFVFGFAILAAGFLLFSPILVATGLISVFISWYQNERLLKRRKEAELTAPSPSLYPRTGFLKGRVLDSSTTQPIAEARVSYTGPISKVAYTMSDGSFDSGGLIHGQYEVLIEKEGYNTSSSQKGVISGFTSTSTYFLSPKIPSEAK